MAWCKEAPIDLISCSSPVLIKQYSPVCNIINFPCTVMWSVPYSTDCASLSIKIHILHILELLFQYHYFLKNTSFSKKEDSLNKLKQVIEYIHNNITNTISLQTLSEICFMSSNYFCHYFKKEIGKTPISFINEYRIEKACEMLSECNLPISNIALSVGFDNFSYFIRKFREYKGITPKEYRLLCKK